MNRRSLLACGALVGVGLCGGIALADDAGIFNHASLTTISGEQIYQRICQGCHMPDGGGAKGAGTYPSLIDRPVMASSRYLALVLIDGRRDMPAFGGRGGDDDLPSFLRGASLTDQQIAAVINYVRSHFGNAYADPISTAEVSALHAER